MENKIVLYMKNQAGSSQYDAKAEYYDGKIIVLKGSKINMKVASSEKFHLNAIAQEKRNEKGLLTSEYILLKNVEFPSASTAGQFVCGYSVNGLASWKNSSGKSLKEILKGER